MHPRHVLMVRPNGYRIDNALNLHSRDAEGNLNVIDLPRATEQWNALVQLYESLGLKVHIVEGSTDFPDMVFSANQAFPFKTPDDLPGFVLGRMKSETRQGEVDLIAKWAHENKISTHVISAGHFEGGGDAVWEYESDEIFGGYGFRTDREAYAEVAAIVGRPIHLLELKDPKFYHLDTCFVALNRTTAAFVEEAFAQPGIDLLRERFPNLIKISEEAAVNRFAGNAFCPDGKNVVLQHGSKAFVNALKDLGFKVHEVETSEFIKSGGSVFCTKQLFWKN